MDISRLIRTQISTSELEPLPELLQSVNDGTTPLLDIVKALGEYLTSPADDVRLKGLTFLTNLLKVILPSRINRQTTQTLTRFYLSKLDDFDSLPPALTALIVLSKLPTFDNASALEVYRAVVEGVNMKAYVQATRHLVYTLFDSFLALHRGALKAMGSDFVTSYTKMVDGEKDPRNLLLLFAMDKVILLEFDVKEHIEDLFDITFCYFPIAFKPPPNDPYGITADDLKMALRGCMSASPYFAGMALPLFLEKFATAVGQSMKDLLLSMAACFPVYGADAVRERGTELWEAIKTEIMYSSDTSIEAAALEALESLMRALYPSRDDVPIGLAQDVIKQCLAVLDEPEKTQGLAATKALVALVKASPATAKFALSQALPQLIRQFNRPSLPSHRTPILWSISSLLIAASKVCSPPDTTRHYAQERSLETYRDSLMDTLREGLRTDTLKEAAVRGCVGCVEIPGFWAREEVEDIVRGMDAVLLEDGSAETRSAVVKGLTSISKIHPTIIESITLPPLFHALPDQAPSISETSARDKYRSILQSLSELCVLPALFETLVIRITNKLDLLASPSDDVDEPMNGNDESSTDARECTIAYAWDLIGCLEGVVDKKLEEKHVDVIKHFDAIASRLYKLCFAAAQPSKGSEPVFRDRRLLSIVGRLMQKLGKHFVAVSAAFEQGQLEGLVSDGKPGSSGSAPMTVGATPPEQDLIALYSPIVQALKADCPLPFPLSADYLASKVNWTINVARDMFQVRCALDLMTAFVNKRSGDLSQTLPGILEKIWVSDIQDTSKSFDIRRRGLLVYLHIVKALALLREQLAYDCVERILDVLKLAYFDPAFVGEAAKGLGVIAEGKGRSAKSDSGANSKGKGKQKEKGWTLTAKLLWAQKMWGFALPRLIEGDAEAKGKDRLVYLLAFAAMLPLVPSALLFSQLSIVLPLLLRSLALPDPETRSNAVVALHSVLESGDSPTEVDKLVHERAEDMVEGLMKSIRPGEESSAMATCSFPTRPPSRLNDAAQGLATNGQNVRAAALRCLAVFPDAVRYESLRAMKSRVVRDLGKALDDPLREVRREAVECRAKWYRYGQAS